LDQRFFEWSQAASLSKWFIFGLEVMLSGIPQGSALGPLFFAIYINYLLFLMKNNVLLFADDTKIYTTIDGSNPSSTPQEDTDTCITWSLMWQLPFNISKCKLLHLGPHIFTK